jgi:Dehydrogenases with different specificities (related to short-chain alcohol dehydrogenases)
MLYTSQPDTIWIPTTAVDPLGFGKVAIVTGCASGIGLAVTQLLLAHQFQVFGLDKTQFDYNLLREADHGRFHFHRCDLTESGAPEESVRICRATFGYVSAFRNAVRSRGRGLLMIEYRERIDVLVNVAGVMDNFSSADCVSDEIWERVLAVNLTAPVKMMRAVLPWMKERREGVIINVASTAATSGAVAGVAYTASKHGLVRPLISI